jgi:hypothetical protein
MEPNTTIALTTFYEAQDYIASKYIFNTENYPMLAKCETDEQRQAFAVTHSLLHINKSLPGFLVDLDIYSGGGTSLIKESVFKAYSVKMLVNIIKLAEVTTITKEMFDFDQEVKTIGWRNGDWGKFLHPISRIAETCEAYDHSGTFNAGGSLYLEVKDLWIQFAGRVARRAFPWKMPELLASIPEFMKSK